MTSDSAMPPTPVRMTRTETSECLIFSTSPIAASTEPCTSALMTRLSSRAPPSLICENSCSSETDFWRRASCSSRRRWARCCASWRATRSDSTTRKRSPAGGGWSKPSTSTGTDGPASLALRPWSSSSARTLPQASPATSATPALSVPRCTSTVAIGPRPMSRRDSITTPCASAFGIGLELEDVGLQQQHLEQLVRGRCAPWRRRRRRSSSRPTPRAAARASSARCARARGWRRGGRSC